MNARGFVAQVARLLIWEEFVKDRLAEDGVKPTRDEIDAYQSDLDYLEGQDTTLEELIRHARAIEKRNVMPTRNFIEGNWSFRVGLCNGQPTFHAVPKGTRSGGYYQRHANITVASDGTTCMFTVYRDGTGRCDARASFAEAKAAVLNLLNAE